MPPLRPYEIALVVMLCAIMTILVLTVYDMQRQTNGFSATMPSIMRHIDSQH